MLQNRPMFAQDCSEEELHAICEGLLVSQRAHRIDTPSPNAAAGAGAQGTVRLRVAYSYLNATMGSVPMARRAGM